MSTQPSAITHSAAASNDEYDARKSGMFGHDDHGSAITWLACAADSQTDSTARAMNPDASHAAPDMWLRASRAYALHENRTTTSAAWPAPIESSVLNISAPAIAHARTAAIRLRRH